MKLNKIPKTFAFLILLVFILSLVSNNNFSEKYISPKNFYFAFFLLPTLIIVLFTCLINREKVKINLNWLDISVIAYYIYSFIRLLFTKESTIDNPEFLNQTLLVIFYFIVNLTYKTYNEVDYKKHINTILLLLLIMLDLNALYGIFQYLDVFRPVNNAFKLGGSFGNPGPYSNFLIALSAIIIPILLNKKNHPGALFNLAIITLILIIVVLPLTKARTAWLGFTFLSAAFLFFKLKELELYKKYVQKTIFKAAVFSLLMVFSIFLINSFLKFKKDSASGRLFIWEVSTEMIKNKPLFGHGYDSYIYQHNNYQASYFENNPNATEKAYLADNTTYAFNEFIQISSDLGIAGLLLFLIIIIIALRAPDNTNTLTKNTVSQSAKLTLLTLLIEALFSYPLRSLPSLILLYYGLACISGTAYFKKNFEISFHRLNIRVISLAGGLLLFSIYYIQIQRFNAEKHWHSSFLKKNQISAQDFERTYFDLYPVMKYNKYFLFNYGTEMIVRGKYEKGVKILSEVLPVLNDTDIHIYLGHAYEQLGQLNKAEEHFKKATFIVPSKFFPKYNLVKLYGKMNRTREAIALASEITTMKVKIKSPLIESIQNEMQLFLTKNPKAGR